MELLRVNKDLKLLLKGKSNLRHIISKQASKGNKIDEKIMASMGDILSVDKIKTAFKEDQNSIHLKGKEKA